MDLDYFDANLAGGLLWNKTDYIYVKAGDSEELKIHAFERCGRHYRVLAYEDDTARIECLKKTD